MLTMVPNRLPSLDAALKIFEDINDDYRCKRQDKITAHFLSKQYAINNIQLLLGLRIDLDLRSSMIVLNLLVNLKINFEQLDVASRSALCNIVARLLNNSSNYQRTGLLFCLAKMGCHIDEFSPTARLSIIEHIYAELLQVKFSAHDPKSSADSVKIVNKMLQIVAGMRIINNLIEKSRWDAVLSTSVNKAAAYTKELYVIADMLDCLAVIGFAYCEVEAKFPDLVIRIEQGCKLVHGFDARAIALIYRALLLMNYTQQAHHPIHDLLFAKMRRYAHANIPHSFTISDLGIMYAGWMRARGTTHVMEPYFRAVVSSYTRFLIVKLASVHFGSINDLEQILNYLFAIEYDLGFSQHIFGNTTVQKFILTISLHNSTNADIKSWINCLYMLSKMRCMPSAQDHNYTVLKLQLTHALTLPNLEIFDLIKIIYAAAQFNILDVSMLHKFFMRCGNIDEIKRRELVLDLDRALKRFCIEQTNRMHFAAMCAALPGVIELVHALERASFEQLSAKYSFEGTLYLADIMQSICMKYDGGNVLFCVQIGCTIVDVVFTVGDVNIAVHLYDLNNGAYGPQKLSDIELLQKLGYQVLLIERTEWMHTQDKQGLLEKSFRQIIERSESLKNMKITEKAPQAHFNLATKRWSDYKLDSSLPEREKDPFVHRTIWDVDPAKDSLDSVASSATSSVASSRSSTPAQYQAGPFLPQYMQKQHLATCDFVVLPEERGFKQHTSALRVE